MSMTQDVQRSLGRIEGKLDALVASLQAHVEDDAENFTKLGSGVSKLNTIIYKAVGGALAIGAIVGFIMPVVTAYYLK